MNTTPTMLARQHHSLLPDLADLFAGFPSLAGVRSGFEPKMMRLEDELANGRYEIRAEIPGIDPEKDVDVTVRDGVLTIKAERSERSESVGRSEFSYGSFVRSVSLPDGADQNDITASYDKGILSVSVKVNEPQHTEKHIAITSTN